MTPRQSRTIRQSDPLTKGPGFPRWLLRLFLFFALVGVISIITWFLWQPPSSITCFTTNNTYCPDTVLTQLQPLQKTPWIRLGPVFAIQREQLIAQYDDIVEVELHRHPLRDIEINVEYAPALFPATVGNQHWQVLGNGYLKPISEVPLPLIRFSSEEAIQSLSPSQRQQFAYLYQKLLPFSPRCKFLQVNTPEEIVAEFENRGQVLLKIGDNQIIDEQLATLQAFFRSSTMDQDYKILDLRFEGQAVIKE